MQIQCWDVYNSRVWCEEEGLFESCAWDAFWCRMRGERVEGRLVEGARGAWREVFFKGVLERVWGGR